MTDSTLLSTVWALPNVTGADHRTIAASGRLEPVGLAGSGDDWSVAEGFLVGDPDDADGGSQELADARSRYRFLHPLSIGKAERTFSVTVFYSWHPSYRTATVIASLAIDDTGAPIDERADAVIALIQSTLSRGSRGAGVVIADEVGGRFESLRQAVESLLAETGLDAKRLFEGNASSWCVERRTYDGRLPAEDERDIRIDYGMSTGDEGWRFVAAEVANERLGPTWSTREFTEVRSAGDGIVMYNAKGLQYLESQDRFVTSFFGAPEPYFALDTRIAGLDHGVLSALERVTVRKARSIHWLRGVRAEQLTSAKGRKRFQLVRDSLDSVSTLVRPSLLSEVHSLEQQLSERMGLMRLIEYLDRLGSSLDERIRFTYETHVNRGITRLTWLTLVLAVVTIGQAAFEWFMSR